MSRLACSPLRSTRACARASCSVCRDALAHRIPLYVPPMGLTEPEQTRFRELQDAIFSALPDRDLSKVEVLRKEQGGLGSVLPVYAHSLSEAEGVRLVALPHSPLRRGNAPRRSGLAWTAPGFAGVSLATLVLRRAGLKELMPKWCVRRGEFAHRPDQVPAGLAGFADGALSGLAASAAHPISGPCGRLVP